MKHMKHDASDGFAIGDRVRVRAGMAHEPEPEAGADGNPGTIKIVEGDAYGVLFDGSDMVHKWYVTSELEAVAVKTDSVERVVRYDRGSLRSPRRTDGGRLRVDGVFTRAGVFEYRRADGTTQRELRPDSEVFSEASLKSLEMLPVVNDHPRSGTIGTDSARAQGWTLEGVRRDGDLVVGALMVTDPALVKAVEDGKRALSVGYEVSYDPTPGTDPVYGRYDGVQRGIRGDHLAVVDVGRAGPEARVRMDSLGTLAHPVPGSLTVTDQSVTMTGKVAETDMDELKKVQEALAAATARADAAEKSLKEVCARADAATGRVDTLEAEIVKAKESAKAGAEVETLRADVAIANAKLDAEKKLRLDAEDPKRFAKAVLERSALEQKARVILGDKFRADLDDRTLMVAAVEKIYGPIADRETRSLDYVRARFDSAALAYVATERALHTRAVDKVVEASKVERTDSRSAREKMIEANRTLAPASTAAAK